MFRQAARPWLATAAVARCSRQSRDARVVVDAVRHYTPSARGDGLLHASASQSRSRPAVRNYAQSSRPTVLQPITQQDIKDFAEGPEGIDLLEEGILWKQELEAGEEEPAELLEGVDEGNEEHSEGEQTLEEHTTVEETVETPDNTPESQRAAWQELQQNRSSYKTLVDTFNQLGSTQTRENTFQPHHSLHRPMAPTEITLSALVAAGAHLGHSKPLMNTNFTPYAYGERAGVTIIDLDSTLPLLRRAAKVVRGVAARDGTVVFVGTRPDLRAVVRKAAERLGPQGYHVGERWLPGTLTNRIEVFGWDSTVKKRIVPDLVIFLNPLQNIHAIRECAMSHVPTIAVIDSNVDPRVVMYPIPANDESTRTAELIAGVLSVAGREGALLAREEEAKRRSKGAMLKRMMRTSRSPTAEAGSS